MMAKLSHIVLIGFFGSHCNITLSRAVLICTLNVVDLLLQEMYFSVFVRIFFNSRNHKIVYVCNIFLL